MEFTPLDFENLYGISGKSHTDERGFLLRVWDSSTILRDFNLVQSSFVTNPLEGTLRGLHFQSEPFSENKVVICISGKIFDVVIDLREDSQTFGRHYSVILGPEEKYFGLYVPKGFAHGYLTLQNDSDLLYFMDKEYSLNHSQGFLWNDNQFDITWPRLPKYISEKDLSWESNEHKIRKV